MKRAHYLSLPALGFCAVASWAGIVPAFSDSDESAYTQTDADGVPLSVTNPQKRPPTAAEIVAFHKRQAQAARDRDWLLRSYEEQLHAHASSQDQDTNLYYQLSSNKELARLAGLPALGPDDQAGALTLPAEAPHSDQHPSAPRGNLPSGVPGAARLSGSLFKPLISPLSAPDAASLHNFYSPLPTAMPMPLFWDAPQAKPIPVPKAENPDSSDVETPGMIAAEKNPVDSDLDLDILPGESVAQAREHQDNNASLELPVAMDADQLHKAQASALSVPTPLRATPVADPAVTPATTKPIPINDDDAPTPVSKLTPVSPVRAPIGNPYDILDR